MNGRGIELAAPVFLYGDDSVSRDAQKTLFHPFETGDLALPDGNARIVFIGAEPGLSVPSGFGARPFLVQGFRPFFLSLRASGFQVTPRAGAQRHDMALVLTDRHRGRNEAQIADALERVAAGGLVVVAGGRDEGIGSLSKRIAGLVALDGKVAKYHGLVFWFRRPAAPDALIAALREGNRGNLVDGRFFAAPGMFSHERIDKGSLALARSLPDDVKGKVADFCAGWGYVAAMLAERFAGLTGLDLYEADYESVEAARQNLAAGTFPVHFFWHDLLSEQVAERYDAIAMNPPFHQGRAAEPGIGQRLIAIAAKSLRKGGRLFMVANRQLPYEQILLRHFARVEETVRDQSFKVLTAWR